MHSTISLPPTDLLVRPTPSTPSRRARSLTWAVVCVTLLAAPAVAQAGTALFVAGIVAHKMMAKKAPVAAGEGAAPFPGSSVSRDPILPDPVLTPGAVLTSDPSVVCHPGYSKTVRHTSGSTKHAVYVAYGLSNKTGHYEIDHLIPLSLGGADVQGNLWPQSYDTPTWNATVKDKLEWKLLHMVCKGQLPMATAQQAMARDWISAYKTYCPTDAACPSYASTHGGQE